MQPGEYKRKPNGILGLLCRLHFPGLVMHAGVLEPAYMWDHYMASPDATDREGRNFTTKARRVVGELWVSHPPTKMVEISHSISVFGMMIAIIWYICRISTGARKAMRPGRTSGLNRLATSW